MSEGPQQHTLAETMGAPDAQTPPDDVAGAVRPGTRLGRYAAVECLGRGGMGEVWLAHDSELDRGVAIKVLRVDRRGSRSGRMLREAQAMARLRHPNVVAVHDVGTWSERVFIAMEYVRGQTLAAWLQSRSRSKAEILSVFDGAARGLAAAHEAGLVHRDFKPDNVMVDARGRVQVMDFGLARAPGSYDSQSSAELGEPVDEPRDEAVADPETSSNLVSQRLTATGATLGTPAYMAPEQHLRAGADSRSDQFAFCVSLYEALYGKRPHAGSSALEIAANVTSGVLATPPSESSVSPRLRRVLLRGLSRAPEDRFAHMEDLRLALGRAGKSRKGALVVLGAVGLVAVSVAAASEASPVDPCVDAADAVTLVWDTEHATALREAFEATSLGFAADTAQRVDVVVGNYRNLLRSEAVEACRDSRTRGIRSEAALDARTRCLQRNEALLSAFVQRAETADKDLVLHGVQSLEALPDPLRCRDADGRVDPLAIASVDPELDAVLRSAELAVQLSQHDRALELLKPLASQFDDAEPSAASVDFFVVQGRALMEAGQYEPALQSTRRAFWQATELGWDELAVRAALDMSLRSGSVAYDEVGLWVSHADALLKRQAQPDPAQRFTADVAGIQWLMGRGKYEEGRAAIDALLDGALDRGVPKFAVVRGWHLLAGVEVRQGKLDRGLALYQDVARARVETLGPSHPEVAMVRSELAGVLAQIGDHKGAEREANAAIEILENGYRGLPKDLERALYGLVVVRMRQGEFEAAVPFLEHRLRRVRAEKKSPAHEADAASMLGLAYWYVGRYAEAEQLHRTAYVLGVEEFGEDHPQTAMTLDNLAAALERQGQIDEALALHRKALPILERALGPESTVVAVSLRDHARALASGEQWPQASRMLQRSARIFSEAGASPAELAETRFDLARALWHEPPKQARAVSLARSARRGYVSLGKTQEVATIDTWLAEHVVAVVAK